MPTRPSALFAILLPTALVPIGAQARPVVLELTTSQGCSTYPPAAALLGEYAGRTDLLTLDFHVTYWDDLGREDTSSFDSATERQAVYAKRLGDGNVTPQHVVDGRRSVVRSLRDLGTSAGQPLQVSVAAPTGESLAVISQASDGRILGAARSAPGA